MPVSSKKALVPEDVSLRLDGTQLATEEGCSSDMSNSSNNEAAILNPQGRTTADAAGKEKPKQLHINKNHTIVTWNVRTMNQGKLEVVTNEMDRINLDIHRISKLKWTGSGEFRYGDHTVFYSGHQQYRKNGAAFIVNKKISKSVLGYNMVNDRIITSRLQGYPFNTSIIQIYAPTTDADENEIEQFYNELQEVLDNISKKDLLLLIGDWNAKAGNIEEKGVTGRFGLGEKNVTGE